MDKILNEEIFKKMESVHIKDTYKPFLGLAALGASADFLYHLTPSLRANDFAISTSIIKYAGMEVYGDVISIGSATLFYEPRWPNVVLASVIGGVLLFRKFGKIRKGIFEERESCMRELAKKDINTWSKNLYYSSYYPFLVYGKSSWAFFKSSLTALMIGSAMYYLPEINESIRYGDGLLNTLDDCLNRCNWTIIFASLRVCTLVVDGTYKVLVGAYNAFVGLLIRPVMDLITEVLEWTGRKKQKEIPLNLEFIRMMTNEKEGDKMKEDEFEKEVEFYRRKLTEFTDKLEKARTKDECFDILGEVNELFAPLLDKRQDILDAIREEGRDFDYAFESKLGSLGYPRKKF